MTRKTGALVLVITQDIRATIAHLEQQCTALYALNPEFRQWGPESLGVSFGAGIMRDAADRLGHALGQMAELEHAARKALQ